ncbi:MAG: hypothetical protein AAF604_21085 [Acidobacteriota bacterium]
MAKFVSQHRSLLGLSLIAAALIALVIAGTASAGKEAPTPELPGPDNNQECAHLDPVTLEVVGIGIFEADLHGSVAARTEESFFGDGGRKTVPLEILGTVSRDYVEGLGEIIVSLDHSRPVKGSLLVEQTVGSEFPASQHMRFHIQIEIEAHPGVLYRSIEPLHVVSDRVKSFPPPNGTEYRLQAPIELEDVANPGTVALRVLTGAPTIIGSKPA